MSTLTDFKAMLRPDAVLEVTNHYITREDHPSFGTTRRTVARVNSSRAYFEAGNAGGYLDFPKASRLLEEIGPDGKVWKILGGGVGQSSADLFLTIRLVRPGS